MKKTLGYIVFTFLLFFMCGINVNATTVKHTICEYDTKYMKIRLFYDNLNGLNYVSGKDKETGNWPYSSGSGVESSITDAIENKYTEINVGGTGIAPAYIYEDDAKKLQSKIINKKDGQCPNINVSDVSEQKDYENLSATKKYDYSILQLECHYGTGEKGVWKVNPRFPGTDDIPRYNNANKFLMDGESYNFAYHFELAQGTASGKLEDAKINPNRKYSKQTYIMNYLYEADMYGCPKSVVAGEDRSGNKWYYLTYKPSVSSDEIKDFKPRGDDTTYKSYSLVCNTSYLSSYKSELKNYYDRQVNTANIYGSIDWSDWKDWKTNAPKDCASKTKKGDFVKCYMDEARENSVDGYQTTAYESAYAKQASKAGCSEKELTIDDNDIQKVWNDLFQKLFDNGIINEEAKEELQNNLDEQMKKISEAKAALFKATGLNELKATKSEKKETISCNELFGSASDEDSLMSFIVWIFNILRFLVPVILIILGSIDFGKVVLSNDKEAMSKALSTFVIRVIIAIAIFLLPTLISLILRILSNAGVIGKDAISCIIGDL